MRLLAQRNCTIYGDSPPDLHQRSTDYSSGKIFRPTGVAAIGTVNIVFRLGTHEFLSHVYQSNLTAVVDTSLAGEQVGHGTYEGLPLGQQIYKAPLTSIVHNMHRLPVMPTRVERRAAVFCR